MNPFIYSFCFIEKINKSAAKLFWEINSAQTTVKQDLLYLIKYRGLGETDPIAIAGEIIRRVDEGKSALSNVLKAQPIRQKNKFGKPPIPIVTIVDEIANIVDFEKHKENNSIAKITNFLGKSITTYEKDPELLIEDTKKKIVEYFDDLKQTFPQDWTGTSGSEILSSNYLAAYVKLLIHLRIDKKLSRKKTKTKLEKIRNNLGNSNIIFAKGTKNIVEKRVGVKKIYEFLIDKSK